MAIVQNPSITANKSDIVPVNFWRVYTSLRATAAGLWGSLNAQNVQRRPRKLRSICALFAGLPLLFVALGVIR